MTISDIYTTYRIPPILQTHQLRVAAVALQICTSLQVNVNIKTVLTAALLHDMGNIIKFDLQMFPEQNEPEGIDYWAAVQQDFVSKYGSDEHEANKHIAKEIGVSQRVLECIDKIGFSNLVQTQKDKEFELRVCAYADMRVGPFGVLSIEERMADGKRRYAGRKQMTKMSPQQFDENVLALQKIETDIFAVSNLKPSDISDSSINANVENLRTTNTIELDIARS